jgi:hypothetical protein
MPYASEVLVRHALCGVADDNVDAVWRRVVVTAAKV